MYTGMELFCVEGIFLPYKKLAGSVVYMPQNSGAASRKWLQNERVETPGVILSEGRTHP